MRARLVLVSLALACGEAGAPPPRAERPRNATCAAPAAVPEAGGAGLPATLGATGCFAAEDPTRPAPGLIAYTINAPLWSDGADKDRWLALPDGARIDIQPDGDLVFPPGTVLVKTFRFGARRVETRFFVRVPQGLWGGYTYAWNDAGTDAVLLDEGRQIRAIDTHRWYFPSRAECHKCHTEAAGGALGLELGQLDRDGQVDRFAAMGLFASAPAPAALPRPDDATLPLAARARAYLHANCANCHRPGVGNSGTTDLRFATTLAATMACDAEPKKGTLGRGAEFRIIAPGQPARSMLVERMRELGSGRMPEFGSLVVDEGGVALISDWISALAGCD